MHLAHDGWSPLHYPRISMAFVVFGSHEWPRTFCFLCLHLWQANDTLDLRLGPAGCAVTVSASSASTLEIVRGLWYSSVSMVAELG
jgi:hypothetical protein